MRFLFFQRGALIFELFTAQVSSFHPEFGRSCLFHRVCSSSTLLSTILPLPETTRESLCFSNVSFYHSGPKGLFRPRCRFNLLQCETVYNRPPRPVDRPPDPPLGSATSSGTPRCLHAFYLSFCVGVSVSLGLFISFIIFLLLTATSGRDGWFLGFVLGFSFFGSFLQWRGYLTCFCQENHINSYLYTYIVCLFL